MKGNFNSITELAQEIERLETIKNDYKVPKSDIIMHDDNLICIDNNYHIFTLNDYAHAQLASKLDIPKRYYDMIGNIEGLRSYNVNKLLQQNGHDFLVRTHNTTCRAIVSNKFRCFDNILLLHAILPVIKDYPDLQIQTSSLTDRRMYLQLRFPKLEGEIKKGDIVQGGIVISNSEVGAGAVDISKMIWRLVCTNGLIGKSVLRKYHIGSRIQSDNIDIFQDDTIIAELESFSLQSRDLLSHALNRNEFDKEINRLKIASGQKIEDVSKTIENVTKRFNFVTQEDGQRIINNMISEGDSSRWGLSNGITALAQEIENQDKAYDLEKVGHKVAIEDAVWNDIN